MRITAQIKGEKPMNTEVTITSADAFEAMRLIERYLDYSGVGFDAEALRRVFDALAEADRILIIPTTQEAA